jgi:hypothetical protein
MGMNCVRCRRRSRSGIGAARNRTYAGARRGGPPRRKPGPMVPPHEAFAQVSAVRLLERLGIAGNRVGRFLTVPPSHTTGRTGRVPGGFSVRSTPYGGPID